MTSDFDQDKFKDPIYEPLTNEQSKWLESSREWARTICGLRGDWTMTTSDWQTVQEAIDANLFDKSHPGNWEGMAVVCADVLVKRLGMVWKQVTDGYGRAIALQYPGAAITSYVCGILVKRHERGEEVDAVYLFSETQKWLIELIESDDYDQAFDKQ